jgi:lysophospholipase L1-like esterase
VALGDSVTLGVGDLVEPGQRPGWAAHAAHALDASRFINLATLGARARTVVDDQLDRALEVRPDLVLVSAGGNDVLRGDLDADQIAQATSRYVGALKVKGRVVVLARLPVGDHVTWLPRRLVRVLRARIARVNAALESVSARHQVPLVSLPAQAPVPAEPLWHVDRIHPGPAGHRLLASGALRAVAPLGLVAATDVPAVTVAPPGAASQMGWLVRNGAPWLVKRSVDLAPALGRQLLSA